GSRIVFDSHRGGKGSALYEIPASGAVPERVMIKADNDDFIAASDWSRDGKYIVFQRSPGGAPPWAIWAVPIGGDMKPFPYKPASSVDYFVAKFSPNGRWLAYSTNESGSYQVVVQPFPDPSGGKWQISSSDGGSSAWRADGRELYYLTPSGEMMAVEVTTDPIFTVGKSTMLFRTPLVGTIAGGYDVTRDGQRFLIVVPQATTLPPITTVLNWMSLLRLN
ncbi:MAG: hypothetical protein DMF88_18360, partial [Acidobacteria bacterium]